MKTYTVKIQFETEKDCEVCYFKDGFGDCMLQDDSHNYDTFNQQMLNCPLVEVKND